MKIIGNAITYSETKWSRRSGADEVEPTKWSRRSGAAAGADAIILSILIIVEQTTIVMTTPSVYQDLHAAIQERTQYGGAGGTAASRIAEQKRAQDTRDNLKKATRVLLEVTKKQEDALKKHLQRAADPR